MGLKVYAVFGVAGEYSDRREWPVKAFRDSDRADGFALACIQEVRRLRKEYEPLYTGWIEEGSRLYQEAKAQGKKGKDLFGLGPECPPIPVNTLDPAATTLLRDDPDYFVYAIDLAEDAE